MATDIPLVALASLLEITESDLPFVKENELEEVFTAKNIPLKDRCFYRSVYRDNCTAKSSTDSSTVDGASHTTLPDGPSTLYHIRQDIQREITAKKVKPWRGLADYRSFIEFKLQVSYILEDLVSSDSVNYATYEYHTLKYLIDSNLWVTVKREVPDRSPTKIWDYLQLTQRRPFDLGNLYTRWTKFRQQESGDIYQHVKKFDDMTHQLSTLGFEIPAQILIAQLGSSLHSFHLKQMVFDMVASGEKSYEAVRAAILARSAPPRAPPPVSTDGKDSSALEKSQDSKGQQVPATKKFPCRFYLANGTCKFGDRCIFRHTADAADFKPPANSASASSTKSSPADTQGIASSTKVSPTSQVSAPVKSCLSADNVNEPQPPALSYLKTSAGFFAQIDGGSQYSLLARSAAERLSSDYPLLTLPHPLTFEAVNGTTFTSDTAVVLNVLGVPIRFIIVDRLPQSISALVGVDLVNDLVIDYVHKTAQHLGTGQKLPLYRPHDSPTCGPSGTPLVGTLASQPNSFSLDGTFPDEKQDSPPEYILQEASPTSPDLPWSPEYNMRIIKDYGWLKIGLMPTPVDACLAPSAQYVFCAEVSQQVLDDAFNQKQVDVKVHKQYLLADKSVQTDCDALVSQFVANGKMIEVTPAALSHYPMCTRTTYYPITSPRTRPIFPCLGINRLLERYGKLIFKQLKIEYVYHLLRVAHSVVSLDVSDAFMSLHSGPRLSRLLTVKTPSGKLYSAQRCIYGLSLSPCVLEASLQFILATHADSIFPISQTTSIPTAPTTSHVLPPDPIDLLSGYNTTLLGTRKTYISSYMDDITLYLGQDLEGHEQLIIDRLSDLVTQYGLQLKPAKIKIIRNEDKVETLGLTISGRGQYLSLRQTKWDAVIDYTWSTVPTFREALSFLGRITTTFEDLLPPHVAPTKHLLQSLVSNYREDLCRTQHLDRNKKKTWDLPLPRDIHSLLGDFHQYLRSCSLPLVPRLLPIGTSPLELHVDASQYMLGIKLVKGDDYSTYYFARQILLKSPKHKSIHISVKEVMSVLYGSCLLRTFEHYSGTSLLCHVLIRCDNVTCNKIVRTHRVKSNPLQQNYYLALLNHLQLLGPLEIKYIPTESNAADILTRFPLLDTLLALYWKSSADAPEDHDDDALLAMMAKRHADDDHQTIGNRVKLRRREQRAAQTTVESSSSSTSSSSSSATSPASAAPHVTTEPTVELQDKRHLSDPSSPSFPSQPLQQVDFPTSPSSDEHPQQASTPGTSTSSGHDPRPQAAFSEFPGHEPRQQASTPRTTLHSNLYDKLYIKKKIDSYLQHLTPDSAGHYVTDDHPKLNKLLILYYHLLGHDGQFGTTMKLDHFQWATKSQDIKAVVPTCHYCQIHKVQPHDNKLLDELEVPRLPPAPFTHVSMDTTGPFFGRNKFYITTLCDRLTCYLLVAPTTSSPTASTALQLLSRVKHTYGIYPHKVLTDNGSIYTAASKTASTSIAWHFSPVYTPQANGQCERYMRDLSTLVRIKFSEQNLTWDTLDDETWSTLCHEVAYALNVRSRQPTGISPYQLVHLHTPPDALLGVSTVSPQDGPALTATWNAARLKQLTRSRQKIPTTNKPLHPDDEVFVKILSSADKSKRSPKFEGPHKVLQRVGPNRYKLDNGTVYSSRHLKRRFFLDLTSDSSDDSD